MPGRAGRREDISLSKVQGNRASVLSLRRTSTWTSQSNGGGLFRPTVLKKRVGLTVVVALLSLIAVILVLGLALERKTFGRINTANRYQHYLWTIPPVIVTVAIAAIVSSMDYSLKRLQPFVNLIKGDASADHSLLLDYVSAPRYLVWSYALKNKHWVVTCSTLATLFCALLSPLASSLFVAGADFDHVNIPVTVTQEIGQPDSWDALLPAYSATNTLASIFSTNSRMPSWTTANGYVIPKFSAGAFDIANSTITGVMPSIRVNANCEPTTITYQNMSSTSTYFRWLVSIKGNKTGIDYGSQQLPAIGSTQFNATVYNYNNQTNPELQTLLYWMFTPQPGNAADMYTVGHPDYFLMACNPTVQSLDVQATIVADTMAVAAVRNSTPSNPQNLSFLNGTAAFNGFYFDTSLYGPIVEQRRQAVMFALVSVMYESALNYPGGLSAAYAGHGLYNLTSSIYQDYMTLFALQNYLRPASNNETKVTVHVDKPIDILTISILSALALSVCLFIVAVLLLAALIGHWRAAHLVPLRADPGSLAGSGLMLGGDVAAVLDNDQASLKEIKAELRAHRWTLANGRICAVRGLGAASRESIAEDQFEDQILLYPDVHRHSSAAWRKGRYHDPFTP